VFLCSAVVIPPIYRLNLGLTGRFVACLIDIYILNTL